ncbi:unnamed protein product [Cochlearia groenlandica]
MSSSYGLNSTSGHVTRWRTGSRRAGVRSWERRRVGIKSWELRRAGEQGATTSWRAAEQGADKFGVANRRAGEQRTDELTSWRTGSRRADELANREQTSSELANREQTSWQTGSRRAGVKSWELRRAGIRSWELRRAGEQRATTS